MPPLTKPYSVRLAGSVCRVLALYLRFSLRIKSGSKASNNNLVTDLPAVMWAHLSSSPLLSPALLPSPLLPSPLLPLPLLSGLPLPLSLKGPVLKPYIVPGSENG